jgi:hypothetical protein
MWKSCSGGHQHPSNAAVNSWQKNYDVSYSWCMVCLKKKFHTIHNIIVDEYIFLFKFLSNWGKAWSSRPSVFVNFDKAAVTIHLASEITYSRYVDRRWWWDLLDSIHLRVLEWIEIDFKIQKAKRFMGLQVHQGVQRPIKANINLMIQYEKKKTWDCLNTTLWNRKKTHLMELLREYSNSNKKCASFSTTYSQYYQRPKSINNWSHSY